jgi:glycosyltransferase involved in cell wall biosynthesis
MRICIVYDCLYPYTVGGAERWYRVLAEALAADGHEVTYLTRRQWRMGNEPSIPGVEVIAVSPGGDLYTPSGRRLIAPPLRFAVGVLGRLTRSRKAFDVVHTCAFPLFSIPAIRAALAGTRTRVVVDWFEVWSRDYWASYLGTTGGSIGYLVQRVCVALSPTAFVFCDIHGRRLPAEGFHGALRRLPGLYQGAPPKRSTKRPRAREVVFAGRHIPEKHVAAIPAAIAIARRELPDLRCTIYGDGPERPRVLDEIRRLGLEHIVQAPGFVAAEEVEAALAEAMCLLLPSTREGYGLVVMEAASQGTPSIVVRGHDNAVTELVDDGENGIVAGSPDPADLAAAIATVDAMRGGIYETTRAWFEREAPARSIERSIEAVLQTYRTLVAPPPQTVDGADGR